MMQANVSSQPRASLVSCNASSLSVRHPAFAQKKPVTTNRPCVPRVAGKRCLQALFWGKPGHGTPRPWSILAENPAGNKTQA